MTDRRRSILGALAAICLVAVGLRLWSGALQGPRAGWPAIQMTYLDLATNIADGHGYVVTQQSDQFVDPNRPPSAPVRLERSEQAVPPVEYYLPGYALLIAPSVRLFGPSYAAAQVVNAVVDGLLGPLMAFLLLSTFGQRSAGLLAAALYASISPLLWQAGLVLPDAFSPLLSLAPCVLAARSLRAARPSTWLLGAGFIIGIGVWFRGELVALVPSLMLLTAACLRGRARMLCGLVLAGWLVGALPLAVFWQYEYKYVALSRPGLGVRAWEGLGRLPNPWGIEERDDALMAFLDANGQQYGTGSGDALALRTALGHISETPGLFAVMSADRFGDVLSSGFVTNRPYDLAIADRIPDALKVAATLALIVAVPIGLLHTFKVAPALGLLLVGMWAARAIPFTLMHEERRDLVPLIVPYLLCVAVLMQSGLRVSRSRCFPRRSGALRP